ncbi:4-hydroxy-3-methylbut-2-enyl diphosphate reductase [Peptostreptococcaceae bacterium AGR-M142]
MKIELAPCAGFCFGVKRAIDMSFEVVKEKENIYSLGPLIHNKQVVEKFANKGLTVVDGVHELKNLNVNKVIIRSHGSKKSDYDYLNLNEIEIVDTTCPYVKKIQNIVYNHYENGYKIIILGNKNHPEIVGINGWCENKGIVVNSEEEFKDIEFLENEKYCFVSQTTMKLSIYNNIVSYLNEFANNVVIFNTICKATKNRQESAFLLSKKVDVMIVIGGYHSSNTQKLAKVCSENVKTYHIETINDLDLSIFDKDMQVGMTAGASTPDWIINEVLDTLKNL